MHGNRDNFISQFFLAIVLLFAGQVWSGDSRPGTTFAGLLASAVKKTATGRAGFTLVYYPVNSPSEPQFRPVKGLDGRDAVPFLIGVLQSESGWVTEDLFRDKEGVYFHIARCYAALSLGMIGDRRAFDPLVNALDAPDAGAEVTQSAQDNRRRYPLSDYAALGLGYLGDPNAVDPLLRILPSRGSRYEFFAYAFALLGDIRAIKPLIQHASQQARLSHQVHCCLQDLCHSWFPVQYIPGRRTYRAEDFPELGELKADQVYLALWRHWDREGAAFARRQFEMYYPRWQRLRKERPGDTASQRHLMSKMMHAGLATLPYIMDRIEKGDDSLLSAVDLFRQHRRTNSAEGRQRHSFPLQQSLSKSESLEWWRNNRHRYEAFVGTDTNTGGESKK